MKDILLINPGRKQKKQEKKTMAKPKKTARQNPSKKKTIKRRSTGKRKSKRRVNPSPFNSSIVGRASSLFSLRNIVNAAKGTGGMLACQFFAKRFADGGGGNDPSWTWKNYAFGLLGTFISGMGADMIKRGSGEKFVTGGLSLLMYKAFINELAPRSTFVNTYFGQDETDPNRTVIGTDGNRYTPGDVYLGEDNEVYLLGSDGVWRPTSENYRDPDLQGYGFSDEMEPVGPLGDYGDEMEPVGPLGDDRYLEALTGRPSSGNPYNDVFLN